MSFYDEVLETLVVRLRQAGKVHLTDPELYVDYIDEDGPRRRLTSKDTTILMLKAFERELHLEDQKLVASTLQEIGELMVDGKGPQRAYVLPTPFEGEELEYQSQLEAAEADGTLVDLSEIENREKYIDEVRKLILFIQEDEDL